MGSQYGPTQDWPCSWAFVHTHGRPDGEKFVNINEKCIIKEDQEHFKRLEWNKGQVQFLDVLYRFRFLLGGQCYYHGKTRQVL